jgi:hypothetical protein
MSSSLELILKIKTLNTVFISYLNDIKNLKSSIDGPLNIYTSLFKDLQPIINKYNDMYDDESIDILLQELDKFNQCVNDALYINCSHDFISTDVDVDPEKTINITYCKKCKLNMKEK